MSATSAALDVETVCLFTCLCDGDGWMNRLWMCIYIYYIYIYGHPFVGCGGLVVIENWERVGGLERENRYVWSLLEERWERKKRC